MSVYRAYEIVASHCDCCSPDIFELGEFDTFGEAKNRARLEAETDLIWVQRRTDAWEACPNHYATYAIDRDDS